MNAYLKALVPLVTAAAALVVQWLTTGHFTITGELVTVAYGVLASLLVLVSRNWEIASSEQIRKALAAAGTALLAIFVQWTETRNFTISQEFVTAVLGLVTTVLVYLVPNLGPLINSVGSIRPRDMQGRFLELHRPV